MLRFYTRTVSAQEGLKNRPRYESRTQTAEKELGHSGVSLEGETAPSGFAHRVY